MSTQLPFVISVGHMITSQHFLMTVPSVSYSTNNVNDEVFFFMTDEHTDFSKKLFGVMSCIGYSPAIVAERRKVFREKNTMLSRKRNDVTIIAAGSKAEGISSSFESDFDRLNIYRDVMCSFPEHNLDLPETATCFNMSDKNCHAGHFTLNLLRHGKAKLNSVEAALITISSNEKQISSDLFTKELEETEALDVVGGWNRGIRTGPAISSQRGKYQRDHVYAFRCFSQKRILKEWAKRDREYNWPTPEIIEEILDLEAQLVPVGCNGSANRTMEWRVCFIPGELKLCESLNETQYKIYILLKLINKHVLRRVCTEISSYMMKNVTFWLVENNPGELFMKENLIFLLKLGLQMLIDAIKNKFFRYYMIPKRNLLIGKNCIEAPNVLVKKLEDIRDGCPDAISILPKLHEALTKSSLKELSVKGKFRDDLEKLELKRRYIVAKIIHPDMKVEQENSECWSDKEYRETNYNMFDIVWPNWKTFLDSGQPRCSLENIIASANEPAEFADQYRCFARSNLHIIWPHLKEYIHGSNDVSDDEIIDLLAKLKAKIEIELS